MRIRSKTEMVYLSHVRAERSLAAEVKKRLATDGFSVQNALEETLDYDAVARVRTAITECDAVVFLATPALVKSEVLMMDWGIAYAWHKPMFVVAKGIPKNELPDNLRSHVIFSHDKISELAEAIHRSSLKLSDEEMSWLREWYQEKAVPLDQLTTESTLLSELATQFRRHYSREIPSKRLLGTLYRAHKAGELPALAKKRGGKA